MFRFCNAALLSAALIASVALAPTALRAADDHKDEARKYHDKRHNDDHEWNSREDRAYRMWAKEKHRREAEFARLNDRDQQAYWRWRHSHSNALLKIEIH